MPGPRPNLVGGTDDLEPISPREARDWYLEDRRPDVTETTFYAHTSRLRHFVGWCEEIAGIGNMNALTGRTLHQYNTWRRDDGGLNIVSVRTQMVTLRGPGTLRASVS